ncbi:MAG: hypothetical protein M3Y50_05380 [Acidobacteriota bacterium]|nr:hypothetical protein [Acidobacteriota bacterium]
MTSFNTRRRLLSSQWLLTVSAGVMFLLASGCASPRPPQPPTLNLPEIVKDLTAERIGDQVILNWTTPRQSTDRLDIKGVITAQICRNSPAAVPPTPACLPVLRLTVSPGPGHATDSLPRSLTTGNPALLAYSVQLFNERGRSAGSAPQVYTAAGASPPAVAQFRATLAPGGVALEWTREDSPARIELRRQSLAPPPNSAHPPGSETEKSSKIPRNTPLNPLRNVPARTEITLQTPVSASGSAKDPGGVLDRTAARDAIYRYTAQRVRSLSLEGHTLTLRSLPSAPLTLTVRDTFPPSIPTGLEAAPGAVTVPSHTPSIDLSWSPDSDADLAGYFVYRQILLPSGTLAGAPTRLTPSPISAPAYRDQTPVIGQGYAYRVTAVDVSGNESAPSSDVHETLREP